MSEDIVKKKASGGVLFLYFPVNNISVSQKNKTCNPWERGLKKV